MPVHIRFLSIALLALTAACAGQEEPPRDLSDVESLQERERTAQVEVENQRFADMTIYVFRGGSRQRLGMVPGNATRTFTIPESIILRGGVELRFLADPIGERQSPVTERITVYPGETIELVIRPGR